MQYAVEINEMDMDSCCAVEDACFCAGEEEWKSDGYSRAPYFSCVYY